MMDELLLFKLETRAFRAYFLFEAREGRRADETVRARHVGLDGKNYVVLRNLVGYTVAVYRVRNDGMLKRLRRWPSELGDEA
jgi:hypothetical protein